MLPADVGPFCWENLGFSDVVLSQICVGSHRDVELQAILNHHLWNLFRQLVDHVEAGILNRLLHRIVNPARSVGHHVERILDFDWDVVCPRKSCCPTVDLEDAGDVTSKLKMSLRCSLLVAEKTLLAELHLCCATCPVEDRCRSTRCSKHHVDGVQLEHDDVELVEVGRDGVQLAQLVPCTAHCVMEGCVANRMSPFWLEACSINLGDGVAFHGVGLIHFFRVPKEHVLVTLFTVTLDVGHHLIRCFVSIEDVDLEHFIQGFQLCWRAC